jgi:hypothetical protein
MSSVVLMRQRRAIGRRIAEPSLGRGASLGGLARVSLPKPLACFVRIHLAGSADNYRSRRLRFRTVHPQDRCRNLSRAVIKSPHHAARPFRCSAQNRDDVCCRYPVFWDALARCSPSVAVSTTLMWPTWPGWPPRASCVNPQRRGSTGCLDCGAEWYSVSGCTEGDGHE